MSFDELKKKLELNNLQMSFNGEVKWSFDGLRIFVENFEFMRIKRCKFSLQESKNESLQQNSAQMDSLTSIQISKISNKIHE